VNLWLHEARHLRQSMVAFRLCRVVRESSHAVACRALRSYRWAPPAGNCGAVRCRWFAAAIDIFPEHPFGKNVLRQLQELAKTQVDPRKLKWRRLLLDISRYHGRFTDSELAQVLSIIAENQCALTSPEAAPVVSLVIDRLKSSPSQLSLADVVAVSSALAFLPIHAAEYQTTPSSYANTPATSLSTINAKRFGYEGQMLTQAPSTERHSSSSSSSAAQDLFWNHLLPRVLRDPPESMTLSERVEMLLAVAVAWRTIAKCQSSHDTIKGCMRALANSVVGDLGTPAYNVADARILARFIAAMGLLELQAFQPQSTVHQNKDSRTNMASLKRMMQVERFQQLDLQTLMLLKIGIDCLRIESCTTGQEISELILARLRPPGAINLPLRDVCNALLLLCSCGGIAVGEPLFHQLLSFAANSVDQLQHGERRVMGIVLGYFAAQVDGVSTPHDKSLPFNPQPHSDEQAASIRKLARYNWFARRHRAQMSWFKCRGAVQ